MPILQKSIHSRPQKWYKKGLNNFIIYENINELSKINLANH